MDTSMKFDLHQDHVRLAMALDNFGMALNTIGQIVMQVHEMLVKAGYELPVKDVATAPPSPTPDDNAPHNPSGIPDSERAAPSGESSSEPQTRPILDLFPKQ